MSKEAAPCRRRMTGLFELYSLKSLNKCPKSGYDIIKEIREKSGGNIVASKGVIYPLLDRLEHDGLLRVDDSFARGRRVFSLTAGGRKYLRGLDARERSVRKRMKYLPFLFSEYDGGRGEVDGMLMRLFVYSENCPKNKRARLKSHLAECLRKMEALE